MVLGSAPALAQQRHVAMTLFAESERPAAGEPLALAIRAVPETGWHGYWSNPGDAGVPTKATWTLPPGVTVAALDYPAPRRLVIAGLMNHVYERPWTMLTTLTVPRGLAPGTALPIRVKLDYLVCTDQMCVPETQELSTRLTVGNGQVVKAMRTSFDTWRRALPQPLGSTATWQHDKGRFRLSVPYPRDAALGAVWFYPAAGGATDYAAAQQVARDGDRVVIETKAAADPARGPIAGVLSIGGGPGLSLEAQPGIVPPVKSADAADGGIAVAAFLGAVLGGLLLNVMPCVFPILSLKALGLARSGQGETQARTEALAYATGVILVCLALGATLLVLRAGGTSAGWAFQLQNPRIVGVLLLLVTGIALNLAGLFELPTPTFAGRHGAAGAFMTGALAAFVATPCTGPFMGAALGAALVLPPATALLVFAGLGIGIALPFLAIGFIPALRRRLPKPGAWMIRLRHILSVPMFATALALAWVLGRQAGVDGMTLGLAAALLAALGLWWTGRRQHRGARAAWVPAALSMLLAAGTLGAVRPATASASMSVGGLPGAEPFSEARLATLRAEGRPVFAYFTADWCLTCKVNEKAAIETAAVAEAFRRKRVAVLVGDWTDGDPTLSRFIGQHNRAGVPLYLWYAPRSSTPRVLPQVLTPATLTELQ